MKLFVKGDVDGLFVLSIQVLLDFMLMKVLLVDFLDFSESLFYLRILPGAAAGLIIGNAFYAYQAKKLAREEDREDVTAIPFGTSALVSIVFVYLVMFPVQQRALASGMGKEEADLLAWHAGIMACVGSGLIEFFGSFIVSRLQRIIPRPALLVAIGGTGLVFIALDFIFRTFTYPLIGFPILALVFILYFSGMVMRMGIPGGLTILAAGCAIAWLLYFLGLPSVVPATEINLDYVGLNLPVPVITEVLTSYSYLIEFLPIIIPIGFIFLVGSLQNIEAAAAAGDKYRPKPMLLMNGAGTLASASFGSPFPATIYLGHPGYKKVGARSGYSTLNAVLWTVICLSGTLSLINYIVPIEAGMALVIFVGIVVCAQSFQASNTKYAPAVVFGLLPALAAYITLIAKHSLFIGAYGTDRQPFNPETNQLYAGMRNFYADGMFALGQGYIFTSMVFTAILMYVIDRDFLKASGWCLAGGLLAWFGFIHSYEFVDGDVIGSLNFPLPSWNKWVTGYLLMALTIGLTRYFSRPVDQLPGHK